MTLPNRAVLLDLDGTLIESHHGILSSCRAALRALGHEPAPEMETAAIIGPPIEDVMRYLLALHGDDRVDAAADAYRADYGARGLYESRAYPGIADALAALRARGLRLYLATSKRRVFARRILEHLGLLAGLDGVYGAEPGGAIDHKPELIAHILAAEGLAPADCVMVGDRRFDVAGAHANRVRAVGVLWGYGGRDELETAGADRIAAAVGDLAGAVEAAFGERG